jgi:uncharacterized protein (DUF2126 family)/transglutaminase-like putative cysteine protease
MSIKVAVNHVTHYKYDRPINLGPHVIRLRPAPHCRTPIVSYSMRITPSENFTNWQQDPFSNYLARLVFPKKTTELRVEVDVVVDMQMYNPFDFFLESSAEKYPFTYEEGLKKDLRPFLEKLAPEPRFAEFVKNAPHKEGNVATLDFVVAMNQYVRENVGYIIRMEPGVYSPEETLVKGQGSCRDSAWLLVQLLRHKGLAARFCSGYSIQLAPDIKALDGPSGVEFDVVDLHAWAEVYLPGAGWMGLDATSGLLTAEGHIPLAATPEPTSAAPITGFLDEAETEFEFSMKVTRVQESPRVTKPYSEEEWEKIEALGHKIDEVLKAKDVRLSMGGEPTFVSIDDMEGAEWNTDAVGPTKRILAGQLLNRLQQKFAPGGLRFYGQGKWYPGEQLPRWALSTYWRRDGEPIWVDQELIADENKKYGHDTKVAKEFIHKLTRTLDLPTEFIRPGMEDIFYYMWKERRLPINVDPRDNKLKDELERERIAKIYDSGFNETVGYTLPLQPNPWSEEGHWMTGPWVVRGDDLFLIPGDSPMGLRLPLDSLPWVGGKREIPYWDWDPMDQRPQLPPNPLISRILQQGPGTDAEEAYRRLYGDGQGEEGELMRRRRQQERELLEELSRAPMKLQRGESFHGFLRTALTVQPRDGQLYVFMPPTQRIEEFLLLTSAVEATARELGTPIFIEGYEPPKDPRINMFRITPDPGVIEVNIHPSTSWDELVDKTNILYEEARKCRLGTEKFKLDGGHTGTGGGNHLVIGGMSAPDSPFLRRPHLLKSLIGYWNNHPSLSYLFSGTFIGPTCQAPRVDEARNDSLYELDLAFRQIPDEGNMPPWLLDRVLRNLLIDVTGNTHRSEFCIDKLFPPDFGGSRHGLLELRAYEMPPHARMSLTQALMLRGLIAKFWDDPYKVKMVPWGTQLHDRFMLPHFIHQDMDEVANDLNLAGFPVETKWFDPHFSFRFPKFGEVDYQGVHLEIRQALEPWHVLGEEATSGGQARYVDSSLERVEVKASGLIDTRHTIAVNGHKLPLHPTGKQGEYVAGVRYRAWQPPFCLHPTIGIDTPLTFDVVDTWSKRSIGGCRYYVEHPGGKNPPEFPVNAYEAEGRRLSRFLNHGHQPGPFRVEEPEPNNEHPFTLDLRRVHVPRGY